MLTAPIERAVMPRRTSRLAWGYALLGLGLGMAALAIFLGSRDGAFRMGPGLVGLLLFGVHYAIHGVARLVRSASADFREGVHLANTVVALTAVGFSLWGAILTM
jgi:hypothetical protein